MKAVLACVFLVLLAVTNIQGRAKPHLIGCYKDNNEPSDIIPGLVIRDLSEAELTLDDSMTVNRCVGRCYRKGYYYAGLQNGDTCRCGRIYGLYGNGGTCDMKCSGNKRQKCGGASSNSIYLTGLTRRRVADSISVSFIKG